MSIKATINSDFFFVVVFLDSLSPISTSNAYFVVSSSDNSHDNVDFDLDATNINDRADY